MDEPKPSFFHKHKKLIIIIIVVVVIVILTAIIVPVAVHEYRQSKKNKTMRVSVITGPPNVATTQPTQSTTPAPMTDPVDYSDLNYDPYYDPYHDTYRGIHHRSQGPMQTTPTLGKQRGTPFTVMCPRGSYINQIHGRYSYDGVERMGFTCSDGTSVGSVGTLNPHSETFVAYNDDGFGTLTVDADRHVNSVQFKGTGNDPEIIKPVNSRGIPLDRVGKQVPGASSNLMFCENGKAVGFRGTHVGNITSLGMYCD